MHTDAYGYVSTKGTLPKWVELLLVSLSTNLQMAPSGEKNNNNTTYICKRANFTLFHMAPQNGKFHFSKLHSTKSLQMAPSFLPNWFGFPRLGISTNEVPGDRGLLRQRAAGAAALAASAAPTDMAVASLFRVPVLGLVEGETERSSTHFGGFPLFRGRPAWDHCHRKG